MIGDLQEYNCLFDMKERKNLIADSIRHFRAINNFQQKEVAKLLRIKYQTYCNYESARSEPPAEILVRLSKLYGVPVDVLVQADNTDKNYSSNLATVERYEKDIKELKEKLKSNDPNTQKLLGGLIEVIGELNDTIKDKLK